MFINRSTLVLVVFTLAALVGCERSLFSRTVLECHACSRPNGEVYSCATLELGQPAAEVVVYVEADGYAPVITDDGSSNLGGSASPKSKLTVECAPNATSVGVLQPEN